MITRRVRRVILALCSTLAIALVGTAAWLYTPDRPRFALDRLYLATPTDMQPIAGLRLHVRDTGSPNAPTLIFLHGFGSSLHTWEPWATNLSRQYRVIRLDLPGFGLTGPDPTGDYSDARFTQILTALLDQRGIRRATIIGNSLGGRLAWKFAAAQPTRVDRLVLISPDGFASPGFQYNRAPEIPLPMRLLPWTLPRPLLRASLVPAYADPARLTDAIVTRYGDLMRAPGVRRAILDRTAQVLLQDPVPLLRTIQAPTLLLWGDQDHLIPPSNAPDYLAALPRARLVRLPNLGHVPFEEAPAEALPPVLAFLREVP